MNYSKYAIFLAFALLIPPVYAQEENESNNSADSPYLEVLKQEEFYQNLTSDEKITFDLNMEEYLANQSPYEREVQKLITEASQLTLDLQKAESDGDALRMVFITAEQLAIFGTLIAYGAIPLELLNQDPSYWAQQAERVSDAIDQNKSREEIVLAFLLQPVFLAIFAAFVSIILALVLLLRRRKHLKRRLRSSKCT